MSNSLKICLLFTAVILLFAGGDHVLRFRLIIPEFLALEQKEADKDMAVIADAISREAYHLEQLAGNWAAWDDMYDYVLSPGEAFANSNFKHESLAASSIDLIFVCDLKRKIIWGSAFYPLQNKSVTLAEFEQQALLHHQTLFDHKNSGQPVSGIMKTGLGPMLVSSQQILSSARTGPARGTVIFGRFLSNSILNSISEQTGARFKAKDLSTLSDREHAIMQNLQQSRFYYDRSGEHELTGFQLLNDIEKKPVLMVEATIPRDIFRQGKSVAWLASVVIFSALAIIGLFLVVWFILFRTENMKRQKQIEALVEMRTQEFQESEERLKTLINATPDIICFKDGEGRWLVANHADLELFHLTSVAYQGKTDAELAPLANPVYKDAFLCCEASDNKAWEHGGLSRGVEHIPTPDGVVKVYDVIKIPLFHADGRRKGLIVFGRDITSEKILRDKLQKSEKMEAIGLMAGGVAHDLNNILSGIIGYPELLLMDMKEDNKARKLLEGIKQSGKRASEVVADLLTVARGVVAPRETGNMNDLVVEYIESPECIKLKTYHPETEILTNLNPDLLNFSCSPVHIKKCLMNLITNAAEAIKDIGKVVITTNNLYVDAPAPENHNLPRGEYIALRISDTGSGIADKDIDRIFEPFYTRKIMGRSGTGLGLAVVWNTIQDHGGTISVVSNPGGTTFELLFPATRNYSSSSGKNMAIEDLQGHGETILVIDDEPHQRDIASQMLTSLGYKVDAVSSGEESLIFLREKPADLIILDMIMDPGIRGRETYEEILKIKPGQRAIIASGFSDDDEVKKTQQLGAGQFVKKPYLLRQIGLAVKLALKKLPENKTNTSQN